MVLELHISKIYEKPISEYMEYVQIALQISTYHIFPGVKMRGYETTSINRNRIPISNNQNTEVLSFVDVWA